MRLIAICNPPCDKAQLEEVADAAHIRSTENGPANATATTAHSTAAAPLAEVADAACTRPTENGPTEAAPPDAPSTPINNVSSASSQGNGPSINGEATPTSAEAARRLQCFADEV